MDPTLIAPFGRSIVQLPVLGQPVGDWRKRLLREHDFELEPRDGRYHRADGLTLTWSPDVFVSPEYFKAFLDLACRAECTVVAETVLGHPHAAFGPNRSTFTPASGGRFRYELSATPAGVTPGEPRAVEVPASQNFLATKQPGRLTKPLVMPVEPAVIWSVRHWFDLLACNVMMLTADAVRMPDTVERGEGVQVHPTACVERCRLGKGVKVGPYAYVSGSTVGDGVAIGNHASVISSHVGDGVLVQEYASVKDSAVGAGAVVSFRTNVRTSVLFGDCTSSSPVVPRSVVAEDTFLSRSLAIAASALEGGTVWVWHRGRRIDTGMSLLGVAVGPGARLGNVTLPAGYEVPSGYYLAGRAVARVAPDLPQRQALVETNGTFRKFGGLFPAKREDS